MHECTSADALEMQMCSGMGESDRFNILEYTLKNALPVFKVYVFVGPQIGEAREAFAKRTWKVWFFGLRIRGML